MYKIQQIGIFGRFYCKTNGGFGGFRFSGPNVKIRRHAATLSCNFLNFCKAYGRFFNIIFLFIFFIVRYDLYIGFGFTEHFVFSSVSFFSSSDEKY